MKYAVLLWTWNFSYIFTRSIPRDFNSSLANLSRFPLLADFVDKCSMDYMPHKHGEHYNKYGKVTKSQMRKIKSTYQIEESNQPID